MVHSQAVYFISNLGGICSITEEREFLLLASLQDRRQLRACFKYIERLFKSSHPQSHVTLSTANCIPGAVTCSKEFYFKSVFLRSAREIRGNFG